MKKRRELKVRKVVYLLVRIGSDRTVHACSKTGTKTVCELRVFFGDRVVPALDARTTDCEKCRTALSLKIDVDPLVAVARKIVGDP